MRIQARVLSSICSISLLSQRVAFFEPYSFNSPLPKSPHVIASSEYAERHLTFSHLQLSHSRSAPGQQALVMMRGHSFSLRWSVSPRLGLRLSPHG
jgi:hypothetical protein